MLTIVPRMIDGLARKHRDFVAVVSSLRTLFGNKMILRMYSRLKMGKSTIVRSHTMVAMISEPRNCQFSWKRIVDRIPVLRGITNAIVGQPSSILVELV